MANEHTTVQSVERRQHPRGSASAWKTAITHIERNRILDPRLPRGRDDGPHQLLRSHLPAADG